MVMRYEVYLFPSKVKTILIFYVFDYDKVIY